MYEFSIVRGSTHLFLCFFLVNRTKVGEAKFFIGGYVTNREKDHQRLVDIRFVNVDRCEATIWVARVILRYALASHQQLRNLTYEESSKLET